MIRTEIKYRFLLPDHTFQNPTERYKAFWLPSHWLLIPLDETARNPYLEIRETGTSAFEPNKSEMFSQKQGCSDRWYWQYWIWTTFCKQVLPESSTLNYGSMWRFSQQNKARDKSLRQHTCPATVQWGSSIVYGVLSLLSNRLSRYSGSINLIPWDLQSSCSNWLRSLPANRFPASAGMFTTCTQAKAMRSWFFWWPDNRMHLISCWSSRTCVSLLPSFR